jgi:hypothetical protein
MKLLHVLVLFLISILLLAGITGCKSSRDLHAYNRVKDSKSLSEKLYHDELEPIHPCVVKDSTVFIQGRDSVRIDTAYQTYEYRDSFETRVPVMITKTLLKRDTVKVFQEDDRRLNISHDNIKLREGTIGEQKSQIDTLNGKLSAMKWKFWGLLALLIVSIGLSLYLKLKPKI